MLSHMGYGYHLPSNEKSIHSHAVLYDSSSLVNSDDGIRLCWLKDFQLTRLQAGFWFILPWIRLDICESQKFQWVTSTSSGIFEVIMLKQYSMLNVWITALQDRFGLISMMWRLSELRFLMTSRRSCTVAICFRSSIMIIGCFLGQLPLEIYMVYAHICPSHTRVHEFTFQILLQLSSVNLFI